jgi:glycosyltransferase involved in cell wall biosynthesis
MACGTPVIAYNHSAMPEVVSEGLTGFIVNNQKEMSLALNKITSLNRTEVRNESKKLFDVKIVAKEYLELLDA